MVEMEVAEVTFDQGRHAAFAVLRQRGGDGECAVPIGRRTAALVQASLLGQRFARPLTYDLLQAVTAALGARLARAVLARGAHHGIDAFIDVEAGAAGILELPCSVEDAVALAASARVRIALSPEIVQQLSDRRGPGAES